MSSKIVYLISGANRGIGLQLVTVLAARPNTVVFAGVRDLTKTAALDVLSTKYPGHVEIVKLTSASEEDNKAAAALIEKKAGQLNVVIANAGISNYYGPAETTPIGELRSHWETNTLGPLVLFQAVASLLRKSENPHFSVISTAAGSIGDYFPLGATAYGSSKAAVNFIVKSLHYENEGLIATAIHPGWVQTDMGNLGATSNGMPAAPVTVEDSVKGILSRIDGATREKSSGKFWNFAVTAGNPWDKQTDELIW